MRHCISWLGPTLAGLICLSVAAMPAARAMETPKAKGMVLVTVSGDLAHSNRGKFDSKHDSFLKYHEIEFVKAMEFDRAILDGLKQGTVTTQPPQLAGPATFTGPLVSQIMQIAGANPKTVRFMALDGFAAELTREQLDANEWILATRMNGRPLGFGQQGPAWLMHKPKSGDRPSQEEEQRWVWALFYIEVK